MFLASTMTNYLSCLLLVAAVASTRHIAAGQVNNAFQGLACGGTKRGFVLQEDFNKWMQLNAHHFPLDGWLASAEVKALVERSEKVAGHFCKEESNNGFGGFAVCNAGAADYDCVSFASE